MMKYVTAATFLLISALILVAGEPVGETDLSGMYEAHGIESDKQYSASVMVMKMGDDLYLVQHTFHPTSNIVSIWMRKGDTISVGFVRNGQPCVGHYNIMKDGQLSGTLISPPNTRSVETLTFKSKLPKAKEVQ